jgi:diacylglycerol kinase
LDADLGTSQIAGTEVERGDAIRASGPAMRSRSLADSFRHAFAGLWYTLRTQRNMRLHLAAALLVGALGLALGLTPVELALLVFAIALVMVAELVNTALEAVVDLAAPYVDPLAGIAKDVSAAAVLLSAVVAVLIGALVLGPHLLALLAG